MTIQKTIINISVVAGLVASTIAPAMAQTTTVQTSKIACVATAVNTREQAIDAAMTAHTAAINAAYTARATALQQAWSQTDPKAIRTSVHNAWKTFRAALQKATSDWRTARKAAWDAFNKAVKQCKVSASATDGANQSSESSGS